MKLNKLAAAVAALGIIAGTPVVAQTSNDAPMLQQGTQEVSIGGRLEFPDWEEVNYDIDGSYGYFIKDGWEVGTKIGASDFGGVDRLDLGVFTEYNFNRDKYWVPYVGAAIGLGAVSFNGGDFETSSELDDDEGAIFDMVLGIKWFVRPYMAISTSVNFQFATEDVFATDDSLEDNLTTLQIGMRFYF